MNDETTGRNQAVALFSAIPWRIPIPKTSYLLIAARRGGLQEREGEVNSIVKNHVFFANPAYSLRVIIIFGAS